MGITAGKPIPLEIKFWRKVEKSDTCWAWIGARTTQGYGTITHEGKQLLAHRVSLQMSGVSPGGQVDHLCRNKLCVNPEHLEPVTIAENTARGNGKASRALRENRCINGHDLLDRSNVRIEKSRGGRVCRTCCRWYARYVRAVKRDNLLTKSELEYLTKEKANGIH